MTKTLFIAELKPGQQVNSTFLLQSKERKIARNGSAYLDLEFRDSTGTLRGKLWDCDRLTLNCDPEDIVLVKGSVEDYQGVRQLTVVAICRHPDDGVSLLDYLPRTRRDPDEMYADLIERVRLLPEGPLQKLLLDILEDPLIAKKYKLAPAAVTLHHAFLGGLLEHVNSLWRLADKLCDHYPWIDRSLVLAGIVLHDVGKIEELRFDRAFRYSTRGQLLGHIVIALGIVREKMGAIPDFPPSLRDRIEHMILSHHGKLEFGSPKEPMFAEALLVHYLDELDSKLESIRAQYETDKDRTGEWTGRNRSLSRELLKPDGLNH
ncbi:MAG TPA: HD domain-containing protein [Terriglobia bacterium]|nr:HD domain-containing protein [Terriglobia bacterium]